MTLRELIRSLARRWYLVVIGLLATAGVAAAAVSVAPPSYEGRAYVALMPGEATYPEGGNPFLYLGGGMTMRDILVRVMATEEVGERVLGGHPRAGFSVAPDPAGGPLLLVTATAPTAEEALAATAAVLEELPATLETLQDGRSVPTGARFTSLVVSQDEEAGVLRSSTNRALITAVVGGLAVTVLLAAWVDAVLESRRGRRRATRANGPSPAQRADGQGQPPEDDLGEATLPGGTPAARRR